MNQLVYPRLPFSIAEQRVVEMVEVVRESGLAGVKQMVALEHPRAAPVATGGRVASATHLQTVRDLTVKRLEPWLSQGEVGRSQASEFDAALGAVLHEALSIVPADAAHPETWNFISLVVFPDVAAARFPALHRDRLMGTARNALRRAWVRQEVLGDLMQAHDRALGEDELVGLFERTALARNRRLLRRLAQAVMAYDGAEGRSAWARELYKRVTFATGPRLLDGLSDPELDDLIHGSSAPLFTGAGTSTRTGAHALPDPVTSDYRGSWAREVWGRAREAVAQTTKSATPYIGWSGFPTERSVISVSPAQGDEGEGDGVHDSMTSPENAGEAPNDNRKVRSRRDVGMHIEAVFQALPEGTFLTVNEIVKRASSEYDAGEVSGGAVLSRLSTGRPIQGVEPVLDTTPKGARRRSDPSL